MERATSRQAEQPNRSEGSQAGKEVQPPSKTGFIAEQRDKDDRER